MAPEYHQEVGGNKYLGEEHKIGYPCIHLSKVHYE